LKNSSKGFLLNPYIIAAIISIIVLNIIPDFFEKYEIVELTTEMLPQQQRVVFEDINGNGKSEKFTLFSPNNSRAGYILHDDEGAVVDQYNLESQFANHKNFWFQDVNKNGVKELYLITKSNDSIFLNIHEHFVDNGLWQEKIYIDKAGSHKGKYLFTVERSKVGFTEDIKTNEIIFSINSGFGLTPRNIYKYNNINGSVKKSEHLINTVSFHKVIPLENDDYKILSRVNATSNDLENINVKKSDYTTWLYMLNTDLSFTFNPIDLKSKGRLNGTYVNFKSEITPIYLFQSLDKKQSSKLIKINFEGEILKEHKLPNDRANHIIDIDENTFAVYNIYSGILDYFDGNLNTLKSVQLEKRMGQLFHYDINGDGIKEFIGLSNNPRRIIVYDKNLEHKVEQEFPDYFIRNYGTRLTSSGEHQFFIAYNTNLNYYKYQNNTLYNLKYAIYILLYVIILGVVFIIVKGQEYRDKTKRNLEKEILELQLKSINNQVDSHFVFNALNTISEMTLSGNVLEVDSFISGYAKFMRVTLENSDKISTTLKEELAYVENFMQLQQLKLKNKFGYKIDAEDFKHSHIKIPKNTLFTFAENAIKYGLPSNELGVIHISLKKTKDAIIIRVDDNGDGLLDANYKTKGTGNGLEIIDKIFILFKERFKTEIHYTLRNREVVNEVAGTTAEIIIKLSKNRE